MFKESYEIHKGDQVWIRDYPLGRPLSIYGKVVACLGNDYYNVLLLTGMNEGKIKKYKSWSLSKKTKPCIDQKKEDQNQETHTPG